MSIASLSKLLSSGKTKQVRLLAASISVQEGQSLLSNLATSSNKFQELRLALLLPSVRADAIRKGIWLVQINYFTSQEVVKRHFLFILFYLHNMCNQI